MLLPLDFPLFQNEKAGLISNHHPQHSLPALKFFRLMTDVYHPGIEKDRCHVILPQMKHVEVQGP